MPVEPDNEDWAKRIREIKFSREDFKGGFTKGRIVAAVIIAVVVLIIAIIAPFSKFFTDVLWYNHVGYQSLFWTTFWAKILMVVIFGAFFFIVLYGNIFLARKIPPPQEIVTGGSPLDPYIKKVAGAWSKFIGIGAIVFSIIAAFLGSLTWGTKWEEVLKFLNHSSFGKTDPVFNKDIGFYMFTYPFQRSLVDWLIAIIFFTFIITAAVYVFNGGIRLKKGPDMLAPHVKAHLSVLLGIVFLLKAWSYRLNMYELLFSKRGILYGAGYTDIKAEMPALWILTILSIVAAIVLIVNIYYKGWILPAVAVGSMVVVTILAGTVYPLLVQNFRVKPNEFSKEKPYLERYISFTRDAYKINGVNVEPFAAQTNLDLAAVEKNQATLNNIRLWDPRPLLDTYEQLQSIRQYYMFHDIDVDRYTVDGVYRQMMIGAREMVQSNLPEKARTWVNDTLVYTHGYGVCMNPSNDISAEGDPILLLQDIPPEGPTNLQVKRPEIYYGEISEDYIVTNTSEEEFDYPKGDEKIYAMYKGKGGVELGSFWNKLMYTVRFADINLLFSGQVKNDSRIMYYRNIKERVQKCAPMLTLDSDPYCVLSDDGKLYWIIDAYTTASEYPYSEPTSGMGNYVRNSVKAVVDAYSGDVKLYVVDPEDPVIQTYMKIFPDIFTSDKEVPEELRKHFRYPEDYFMAQANILRTFHMTNAREFYNKEDEWDFPQEVYDSGKVMVSPYYVIMKLPGAQDEEMVLMLPFVPHGKQNMISWFAARMDGEHYGELGYYLFPSGELIFGPEQIEGRIDQDPEISKQLSLWKQEGSQVIRGNLLVIPIEQSLLYVEPLYLQASEIKIPQIKRVVVIYGQQVVMEPTLDQALARIFAGAPGTEVTPDQQVQETATTPIEETSLGQQALDLYNKATEAQKNGDWSAYGDYLNQLKAVLEKLAGEAK
ncbi:MAG: UPF0182 family protein [Actinobacteria bacterium]|nr:UPF0182 family protein [Actinomycetota bacterium]